jgi:hypothetical protein
MDIFICLACWIFAGFQEPALVRADHAKPTKSTENVVPTPQEALLAQLLAELPDDRRAELITRALANSRIGSQAAASGPANSLSKPGAESDLDQTAGEQLQAVRSQQQALALELSRLRAESKLFGEKLDAIARRMRPDPIAAPQGLSQTFVLPKFQRPGIPALSGPYVNQPSGPILTLRPETNAETEQSITLELAQLSRNMFRLNQRLQQLQANPEASAAPSDLNQAGKSGDSQASRPSPLLPR